MDGYALVGGKCIAPNNCREYAEYVETSTSTMFSADNCKCFDGYSRNSDGVCLTRCYIRCRTCTSIASNKCLTCEDGYVHSGTEGT